MLRTASRESDRLAGEEFSHMGASCVGVFSAVAVDQLINAMGGVNDRADYTLTARLDQFLERPRVGEKIRWNGSVWAVKSDTDPENKINVVLTIIRA